MNILDQSVSHGQKTDQPNVRAILFDLGQTLVNFSNIHKTTIFRQSTRLSYDFLTKLNQPAGKYSVYCWRNLFALRVKMLRSWLTGNDFNAMALLKKLAEKTGVRLSEENWKNFVWLWYKPLSELASVEPDIIQTLSALKQKGIKLAVVSNTFIHSSAMNKHLAQLGILDLFDFTCYSYQLDFRKPDPRIFTATAEMIGEKVEDIMFVGDRLDNDVNPAVKVGMTAVLKSTSENASKKLPRRAFRVDTLAQLPGLVEKITSLFPVAG